MGALPVIIDLGGTKPLGGICIYLGGTSDPQGNHEKVMDITLFLFSGQLLLDIRHLGCCWKGKDDTVCMYVFNGDTGVLFYFALGQLTVVS